MRSFQECGMLNNRKMKPLLVEDSFDQCRLAFEDVGGQTKRSFLVVPLIFKLDDAASFVGAHGDDFLPEDGRSSSYSQASQIRYRSRPNDSDEVRSQNQRQP